MSHQHRMIHKSPLYLVDTQEIFLPHGAKILSVANQADQICLWYDFDIEDEFLAKQGRRIRVIGTGNNYCVEEGETFVHLGTVMTNGGRGVWHIFEAVTPGQPGA